MNIDVLINTTKTVVKLYLNIALSLLFLWVHSNHNYYLQLYNTVDAIFKFSRLSVDNDILSIHIVISWS